MCSNYGIESSISCSSSFSPPSRALACAISFDVPFSLSSINWIHTLVNFCLSMFFLCMLILEIQSTSFFSFGTVVKVKCSSALYKSIPLVKLEVILLLQDRPYGFWWYIYHYFIHELIVLQVSLRNPLRQGAEDHELREIIGAAVCTSDYYGVDSAFHYLYS